MIPDVEAMVGDYLRAEVGGRVVGNTPSTTATPWVRVTVLDSPAVDGIEADHLLEAMVQLDCYAGGGGQGEASLLARTVRAALVGMPGKRGGAVVTAVRPLGMPRVPDADFTPARERYILTALIHLHG